VSQLNETLAWAEKIGGRLRERRKSLGLSLGDLSRLSGSTVSTLSNIERGTRDVKLSTLVSLTSALRLDLPSLFVAGDKSGANQSGSKGTGGYRLDDD
jgi:transcriptional regulator with XRE-family HTH domain